jgi:hypothetical protein
LAVIDLNTGAVQTLEMTDLADAFDLALVNPNLVALNARKPGVGHVMRFVYPATLTEARDDIVYTTDQGVYPGRLVVTPSRQDVFVSHRMRIGQTGFDGQIYCVNISRGIRIDADSDTSNGNFAFDHSLVSESINWPFDLAIDPVAGELLAGNYRDTLVIAIALSRWGNLDRDSHYVAPIPGVRKIDMSSGTTPYAVLFWDFADGVGIAGYPGSGQAPIVSYQSGGSKYKSRRIESGMEMISSANHLAMVPARGSWFTLFRDPERTGAAFEALEERSLATLERVHRFETRFQDLPIAVPRAFAVNHQTNRAYVAYQNRPFLEVFELPNGL